MLPRNKNTSNNLDAVKFILRKHQKQKFKVKIRTRRKIINY